MFPRRLAVQLRASLGFFPAVALLGARQVGKTTLARQLATESNSSVYLDLENRADRAKLTEPELFFANYRRNLVVLDEIQQAPEIFSVLRPEIDANRQPGRFLLLGSAAPTLLRQTSESLAGRIAYHELGPLTVEEVKVDSTDLQTLWSRGGFPSSFTAPNDGLSVQWRENFIRTFLERDLPQLGIATLADTMHRFWRMLAHHHGQLFNASQIASSLGVSSPTIARYLDSLVDALVVRRLEPLHVNVSKRLVKSPKVYIRNSGLLHALLGIDDLNDLQGHPIVGHSWEGFVLEHIAAYAPPNADLTFYRTAAGAEIDVIVNTGSKRIGFEIKYSAVPKPSRGFWNAIEELNLDNAYVVAPISDRFPLSATVEAISPLHLSDVVG